MTKSSGLGAGLFLSGTELSGDTQMVGTISKGLSTLPFTGINKYATERKAGVLRGIIDFTSFFNPTDAHPVLSDLPRTDVIVSYVHKLATLGTPVASMVAKQTTYDPKRGTDGSLLFDVKTQSNAQWIDWGLSLTATPRTDTAATNGTGVDFGASYAFGLSAVLHVMSFTGTNATIKLQESSDNGAGDAWADVTGGSFTLVTGAGIAERIATAFNQTIERYLRVVTSGTFTSLSFLVSATVNQTDVSDM